MSAAEQFTRADIESLLADLDERLASRGIAARIYIVGGAAIALRGITDDRRTGDVDALLVPEQEVLAAARGVAEARGIRSTWLSAAAKPWIPPMSPALSEHPQRPGLEQRLAPDEHRRARCFG